MAAVHSGQTCFFQHPKIRVQIQSTAIVEAVKINRTMTGAQWADQFLPTPEVSGSNRVNVEVFQYLLIYLLPSHFEIKAKQNIKKLTANEFENEEKLQFKVSGFFLSKMIASPFIKMSFQNPFNNCETYLKGMP